VKNALLSFILNPTQVYRRYWWDVFTNKKADSKFDYDKFYV